MSRIKKIGKTLESILISAIKPTPVQISILVSYKCNLNCNYCYQHSNDGDKMPFEDFKTIVRKAEELSAGYFNITGGEPITWEPLSDAIQYLTEKNFASHITTNGFLLTDKITKELGNAELDVLNLSLDGIYNLAYSDKTLVKHDTGLVDRLNYLRNNFGVIIKLNGVITKNNLAQIPTLLDFASKNKFLISLGLEVPKLQLQNNIKYGQLPEGIINLLTDASNKGFLIEPIEYFNKPEFDCYVAKKKSLCVGPDSRIQYCFKTNQKWKNINAFSQSNYQEYLKELKKHIDKCNPSCTSNCSYMGNYFRQHPMGFLKLFFKSKNSNKT